MHVPEQYVRAGKLAREMREWILENVSVPQTCLEIATSIEEEIARRGGQPAFPTGIGINGVTAHYAPQEDDQTRIGSGDLVKIDYGVHFDGYIADTAVTMTREPGVSAPDGDDEEGAGGRDQRGQEGPEDGRDREGDRGHRAPRGLQDDKQPERPHARAVHGPRREEHPQRLRAEPADAEARRGLRHRAVPDPGHGGRIRRGRPERLQGHDILAHHAEEDGVKELDGLVDHIWNLRKSLPFTPRWFTKEFGRERLPKLLAELERRRIVRGYPTLVEASNAPVAQFEHTMKLEGNSLVILT